MTDKSDISPIEALDGIARDIFERWDADQRSGKLCSALAGTITRYDPRVSLVRDTLEAYPLLIEKIKKVELLSCGRDDAEGFPPPIAEQIRMMLSDIVAEFADRKTW